MRLLDLHLRAFGPFTDRHLDLSGGEEGLHVVFGPNEAGKSSALRALRAFLYGIPERTQDDFLHGKTELRVGGRLRGGDGENILCYRRKGRKNTLLDGDDRPLAEDALRRLLGGVDERLFEHLFAIDHESLVSGGQALLAERGREAEALFGSGLGSSAIHSVLEGLDREAQELFAPRASKPRINAQLGQLAETGRRLREVSLSARQWDEARKAVEHARKQLLTLEGQLADATRRRSALERIRRTLPGLAKRTRLRERLADLDEVPHLDDDFGQRREQADSRRRLAVEGRLKAKSRLDDLRDKAGALAVSEELLAEAEAIDDLREQLGSHRKAARDRPRLVAEKDAAEEQARQRLVEVRPDLGPAQTAPLRPLLGRRRQATELGGRREALAGAVKEARSRSEEIEAKLTVKREALEQLPETPAFDGLRRAVEAARRAGDLDHAVAETRERLHRHEEACARDLAALGLWTGDLEALHRAPLPVEETLHRYSGQFLDLDNERRQLDQARSDAAAEQRAAEESIRALELAGKVPAEADLQQARRHREEGWILLKQQWLDGTDVAAAAQAYGKGAALPEAFEAAVTGADEVADRLRREAQRVHERATVQARLEGCARKLDESAAALEQLGGARGDLEQSWQALWADCGVSPLPPREMADWLARASRLREKVDQGNELIERLEGLQGAREVHRKALDSAVATLGEPAFGQPRSEGLSMALDRAEARLAVLEQAERRRTTLTGDIEGLEESLRRLGVERRAAEDDLKDWQSDWSALMGELGIAPDAGPGEVSDYLQAIADTLQLQEGTAKLAARVTGIDQDAQQFGRTAGDLLVRLAPDLSGRPLEEAVLHLHARLGEQREANSRLQELRTQVQSAEEEVRGTEAEIRAADQVLGELCRQAGCESPEQLLMVEQRYQEQQQLIGQLHEVESDLIDGGDGLDIEALSAEAQAADRDAVLAELTAVEQRIEQELRPQQKTLLEQKVGTERDFAAMAGGDLASILAEETQQTLSSLRADAERYVRLKLAGRVLRDEIERFRRRHRDPILTRTSRYFAQLTCGAFAAVETDFDEADQPVLVGVRPNEERLRVEGMSTGTHDQLYLALRLATLDHYMDNSDPLPFIVDDILIQFDDGRASATLEALAGFSDRNQVILFTHHGRVAEQAASLEGAQAKVFVHELG